MQATKIRCSQKDDNCVRVPSNECTTYLPVIQKFSDDCYKMNHPKRGYAHVFNHIGDGIDKTRIEETLIKLKFEVQVYEHLTYSEIDDTLETLSSLNYKDVDCFMIVIITHGDTMGIEAKDEMYNPDLLWTRFTSDICPSLTGKPKLFLIDSCRGKLIDKGVAVEFDGNDPSLNPTIKIPKMADILIMFSTQEGHLGYGDGKNGSWFMQAFCEEVAKRHETMEFFHILTVVNRRVALCFEGRNLRVPSCHGTKQISSIVSSCTRLLYLS